MSKFKLVGLTGQDTIPDIRLENFEFDKDKEHVVAITVDVSYVVPADIKMYIERLKSTIDNQFPKNVKVIYIPRTSHNDLTGIYKVI